MIDPIIIDDLIPIAFQDNLLDAIIKNARWQYAPATVIKTNEHWCVQGYDSFVDSNTIDSPQFIHNVLCNGQTESSFSKIYPIIPYVEKALGKNVKNVERIKINALAPTSNFTENNYNVSHVDDPTSGKLSMVYYVNDSDGDTFLFNEQCSRDTKITELTIKQRVTPKKGRAVIFDSNRLHASSNPIITPMRFVINFVFEVK